MTSSESRTSAMAPSAPALPRAPRSAWMWKPRSKLVDAEKSASVSTFLKLRSIGAKQWRRRFVFVDRDGICYGSEAGAKDKVIHFESIQSAGFESTEGLIKQKAPREFADFGWYLHVEGRQLLFCAENKAAADEWVLFVQALLAHMRALRAPAGPTNASAASPDPTPSQQPAPSETAGPTAVPDSALQANTAPTTQAPQMPEHQPSPPAERTLHESFTVPAQTGERPTAPPPSSAVPPPAPLNDDDDNDVGGENTATGADDASSDSDVVFDRPEPPASSDDESDSDADQLRRRESFSRAELGRRGGRGSFSTNSRRSSSSGGTDLLSASSEDTEGDDDDDDVSEGGRHASLRAASAAPSSASSPALEAQERPISSVEEQYAQTLLPIAQDTHSHIGFRVPSLAAHLKGGDTPQNVVFSRSLEKIGKRDNPQPRDLVLTPAHLYLFTRKHVGGGSAQTRCIPTDQIVGVAVSTTNPTEMAILIPSFHDILLRITPQNSRIGGTETQVRQQLIAHLFKVHRMLGTGRRFVFREVPDVRSVIRRSTEDKHLPLASTPEDITHAASCATLYPTFRANADSVVHWSSVVRQVRADRKPVLRILVVTDGAFYLVLDNLSKVVRRTSLDAVSALYYDTDAQTILLQCTHASDVLFNVQKDTDFDGILRVVPAVAQQSFGRRVRAAPSKQLYAHARLAATDATPAAATATTKDAPKPKSGHHTLSRQLKSLWKAGMGKENKYAAHATKAAANALADDDNDDDRDGDPLNTHRKHDGGRSWASAEQALYAMYRFVEEVVLDYDDELRTLKAAPAAATDWDTLTVQRRFATPPPSVGAILFSAPCIVFDSKEVSTLAKANQDAAARSFTNAKYGVCITTLGIFLVKGIAQPTPETGAGSSSSSSGGGGPLGGLGSKASRLLRSATARATTANAASTTPSGAPPSPTAPPAASLPSLEAHIETRLVWADIIALVRCRLGQTPLVGIMTARSQPQDILMALPTERRMLDLMTAAAQSYATTRIARDVPITAFGGSLPLFAAPRAANVARALKKTLFDPFPTVSLRHTAASYQSDALRMAVVPEVADVCRRFGDNTIFFSGVAWRIRSATLRHENGTVTEDPGPRLCRHNNNLYKSYILLLTNCALYHCAKGGFEVMRRTSLLDVEAVYVSTSDPDTIMLTVPTEYDMYFRLESRGAEFLQRLQEAYAEWTNYAWYRPHERQGTHRLVDYFVPVHRVTTVATHGQLTKPPTFNALQANRSPVSVRKKTQRWHERHLETALAHFERALEVGRTGVGRSRAKSGQRGRTPWTRRHSSTPVAATPAPATSTAPSAAMAHTLTWPQVREQLALAQSLLYFTQRRCFRVGLRGDDHPAMSRAQTYLAQYARLQNVVTQLEGATIGADTEAYEQLLSEAAGYPELTVLIAEQSARYGVFRRKQQAVKAVLSLAMQATNEDLMDAEAGPASLVQSLPQLATLMQRAVECGVDPRTVRLLTFYIDVLAQREQLTSHLGSARGALWLRPVPSSHDVWAIQVRRTLVQVVRRCLFMPSPPGKSVCLDGDDHVDGDDEAVPDKDSVNEAARCSPVPAVVLGVRYLLAHNQHGWAAQVLAHDAAAVASGALTHTATDEAALVSLRSQAEATTTPDDRAIRESISSLSACIAQHQRRQDWTEADMKRLHRECDALSRRVSASAVGSAGLLQDVLRLHMDSLAARQRALVRRAELDHREAQSRLFYEAETARQAAVEARAEKARAQREQSAHVRRRNAFYATWRARVQRLQEDLQHAMQVSDATQHPSPGPGPQHLDGDKVRLIGRQCAQLQTELNQSVQAFSIHHAAATPGSSASEAARKPAATPVEQAELLAQISDVSETARDYLIREAHGGVNPYALQTRSSTQDARDSATSRLAHTKKPTTPIPPTPRPAPVSLPAELEAALVAGDADTIVRLVQQHEHELSEDAVAQVRARWRDRVQKEAWARGLRSGLEAAMALHSLTLLQWHLSSAAAQDYSDDVVEQASRLCEAVQAASTPEEQAAVWDAARTDGVELQDSNTHGVDAVPPETLSEPRLPPTVSPSPSPSSASSVSSSDADSDIHLDSLTDDDEEEDENTAAEDVTEPCEETDPDLALTDDRSSGVAAAAAASPLSQAAEPLTSPTPLLQVFVQTQFPQLDWPPASAVVAETTPTPASGANDNGSAPSLDLCHALATVLLHFLEYSGNTLRGSPEDATCVVECAADNPHLADLIFQWMQVWTCGLRPDGIVRKTPRYATDVMERVADRRGRDGALLSPHTNRLLGLFLKANRFQTVRGPASDFAFIAYVLQERVMEDVLLETSRLEEKERAKLMDVAAPLRHVSLLGNLLSLAHVCRFVAMPCDVRQPAQLHQLLLRAANATTPTKATSTATAPETPARPSSPPPPQAPVPTVPAQQDVEEPPRVSTSFSTAPQREALMNAATASLRHAVQALVLYFKQELASTAAHDDDDNDPPAAAAALTSEAAHLAAMQALFDEHAHPALIPVLATALEPALLAFLEAGFQARYQLVRTRTLWDLLQRFAQHLRESSRSLVGVEIVGAVELVAALTDDDGRYKARLEALSEVDRGRACMRIFLRQCLNRRCLAESLEALFPTAAEDGEWGGEDGIWSFYERDMCLLYPRGDPKVDSVFSVLRSLSRFPFSTAVDRALW